jgi:hypothetical protein
VVLLPGRIGSFPYPERAVAAVFLRAAVPNDRGEFFKQEKEPQNVLDRRVREKKPQRVKGVLPGKS